MAGPKKTVLPRTIWVLVGAQLAIALGYGIVSPVIPQFAQSFGVRVWAATLVVSAFAFFRLAAAPTAGTLVEIMGERRTYLAGVLIVAVSSAASAFVTGYWQLLAARGMGGVGSVMFTVSTMSLMVRLAPPGARGRASALYGTSMLAGNIAGPMIGALLSGLGMRAPFLIYAAFIMVSYLTVYYLLPSEILDGDDASATGDDGDPGAGAWEGSGAGAGDGSRAGDGSGNGDKSGVSNGGDTDGNDTGGNGTVGGETFFAPVTNLRGALGIARLRVLYFAAFAHGWVNLGLRIALVPLFAPTVPGGQQWSAGVVLTAYALGTLAILPVAGNVVDRVGRKPSVVAGFTISTVLVISLGFAPNVWALAAMCFLAGVGSGFISPAQQAAVTDVVAQIAPARVAGVRRGPAGMGAGAAKAQHLADPSEPLEHPVGLRRFLTRRGPQGARGGGKALAYFQMSQDLGVILGPVVTGLVADTLGYTAAFSLASILTIAAAAYWLAVRFPPQVAAPER